ncbi:protein NO VEIN domain-containing protein [Arthrobacter sp. C152]
MVINIRLSDRTMANGDDPLEREWYGYDPAVTPEELWAHNRGDYSLDASRVATERWAALNYKGRVVLVAELGDPDHEILPDIARKPKKALIGRVLSDGDSIHDALIGTPVVYDGRNSIKYGPDPQFPGVSAVEELQAPDCPGARGQGLQMDAVTRKVIEDTAQDRLMRWYRQRGWTVTDTRLSRPYDAVAVKGNDKVYLEAKGTQSGGGSVIVTRNEVDHAREHPGQCRMGVWSEMRLLDGVVDPDAGTFRILAFDPDRRDLRPRDFDWTLPGEQV